MTATSRTRVHFSVVCSAMAPAEVEPFRGQAVFDADGVTIRGWWGGQRAAYAWGGVRHVKLLVTDEREENYWGSGFRLIGWLLSWYPSGSWSLDVPTPAPGRPTSSVRRTGTLELVTDHATWHLRVLHRAPYQVTNALRPFVAL